MSKSNISKKTYLVSKIGEVNVRLLAFQMHLGIKLYTVSHLKALNIGQDIPGKQGYGRSFT